MLPHSKTTICLYRVPHSGKKVKGKTQIHDVLLLQVSFCRARLRQVVADQALDVVILKEAAEGEQPAEAANSWCNDKRLVSWLQRPIVGAEVKPVGCEDGKVGQVDAVDTVEIGLHLAGF